MMSGDELVISKNLRLAQPEKGVPETGMGSPGC